MDYGLTIGITQILQVYTAPSYAHTEPSYAYTKPSYAHTEPSYAYTAPSYAYTKLSYTSTEASYSSRAPCAFCTRRPPSAGVWSECAEQGVLEMILALDLGTTAVKAAVVSARGELLAWDAEPQPLILTPDGGVEQDPRAWCNACSPMRPNIATPSAPSVAPRSGRARSRWTQRARRLATQSSGWTRAARLTSPTSSAAFPA